jgi:hypothetical protein
MSAHAHSHPQDELENPDVMHETSDISVRAVIWFVVVMFATVGVMHVTTLGFFKLFDHMERANDPYVSPLSPSPASVATPSVSFPEPRLQTTPWEDLKNLRADETGYLNSYGWVDQKAGEAHIPIDKAKEMLLQRGIAVRPELGDATEGTHFYATGESSGGRNIPASTPAKAGDQNQKPGGEKQ